MKVLLSTLNSKYIHSNLAIRYLKQYCLDIKNVKFIIEEYTINDQLDNIISDIYFKNPDIVCFSCYIWNIQHTLDVCRRIKMLNDCVKIVLGGPEVSYNSAELLSKYQFIDCIVRGEGEQSFKQLMDALIKGRSMYNIAGISFRDGYKIIQSPDRALIQNLDDIPFAYSDINELAKKSKLIYYECSRGCPYNCEYCLSSCSTGVRFFSLDRVKKDLMTFINIGVDKVKFVDRTFNCNMDYAIQIFLFLIKNSKNTCFHFEINGDLIKDEMIDVIKQARPGLFQFEIGVQSTNRETLDSINRKMDFDRLKNNVKKIYSMRNIHLHLDLIAGLPYETYQIFSRSFNHVYSLKPDRLQLGFLKLLKGTRIRKMADKYGYIYTHRAPYEVVSNKYISYSEIVRLKMVEHMVEIYWNKHAFDCCVEYIIKNYFNSAFEFFEQLSKYYFEQGYAKYSHSRQELYDILFEFYKINVGIHVDLFCDMIKFDYLRCNKTGKMPECIKKYSIRYDIKQKSFDFLKCQQNISKFLPHFAGKSAKHIIKYVHFEQFENDIISYINGCGLKDILSKPVIVLFDYHNKNILNQADCKAIQFDL